MLLRTAGHEAYHFIEDNSAESAKILTDFVIDALAKNGMDIEVQKAKLRKRYSKDGDVTDAQITAEIVADGMFEVLNSKEAINRFVRKNNPKAVQRVIEAIDKVIASIRSSLAKMGQKLDGSGKYIHPEIKALVDDYEALEEIRKQFMKGMESASASFEEKKNKKSAEKAADKSSGIKFSKKENYSSKMQNTIEGYLDAVDENFLSFIEDTKIGVNNQRDKYFFGKIKLDAVEKINSLLGIDTENWNIAIEAKNIQHILKDHGENGKTDNSLSNNNDLARIAFILENFDSIEKSGYTNAYKERKNNGFNKNAPTIKYKKKVNGVYYVVQAVPNTKAKTLYIVTGYISENKIKTEALQFSGSEMDSAPEQTSKNANASASNNSISNESEKVNIKKSLKAENIAEQKQLDIINKTNPAPNTYSTWIRTVGDIKTLSETLEDSDWDYEEFNPDLSRTDIMNAVESGKITVYSSYPIENGFFVSPSRMEAESYSANGKVYQKTVDINDVAWIDPTQGQFAKNDIKKSLKAEDNSLEQKSKISYSKYADLSPLSFNHRAQPNPNSSINWVLKSQLFSVVENKLFHQKISEINQGSKAFAKNQSGEYMLPIENKIVFTDGDYNMPEITRIIEVVTDSSTRFEDIKEIVSDVEKGRSSVREATQIMEDFFGKGYILQYEGGSNTAYEWETGKRKGKDRREAVRNCLKQQQRERNDSQVKGTDSEIKKSLKAEDDAPTAIDRYYAEAIRENRAFSQIFALMGDMYSTKMGDVYLDKEREL